MAQRQPEVLIVLRQPGGRRPVDQAANTERGVDRNAHQVFGRVGDLQLQQVVREVANVANVRKEAADRRAQRRRRDLHVAGCNRASDVFVGGVVELEDLAIHRFKRIARFTVGARGATGQGESSGEQHAAGERSQGAGGIRRFCHPHGSVSLGRASVISAFKERFKRFRRLFSVAPGVFPLEPAEIPLRRLTS
jgi:hypothetical protein